MICLHYNQQFHHGNTNNYHGNSHGDTSYSNMAINIIVILWQYNPNYWGYHENSNAHIIKKSNTHNRNPAEICWINLSFSSI